MTARELAEARRRDQEERARQARLREEEQIAKARRNRLDALARRGDKAWTEVDDMIAMRNNGAYDRTVTLLVDLRDLALEQGTGDAFRERVAALRQQHASKPNLVRRLATAGLA